MSTTLGSPFITVQGGSPQTVSLYSNYGDLLNYAYVAVFTNINGSYNFAGNSYGGYFKFVGMDTAENAVYIIAVGGGGGGGGAIGTTSSSDSAQVATHDGPGQGGGGGGTCLFWFNQLDPAYTYAVSVGVGGVGGGGNGANGINGGSGGNTIIDVYDIDSSGNYNFQYNLMTAYGGGGGDGDGWRPGQSQSGGPGGAITGIPNWGSYPYNSNPTYNDIGIDCNYTGGSGGGGNSVVGNSTFPQLNTISNGLATTYNNELPWINTLIANVSALQNWYGGGGQQGGKYTNTIDNSYGGNLGIGGTYCNGSNNGCGCAGKSYGDAGGGAYWYEDSNGIYHQAYGGNGIQGCVIVVMIPGYSSIACNPNSTISSTPPVPSPMPAPPPHPPINAQTISAEDTATNTECCEVDVSVSTSSTKSYTFDEIVKYIEKNQVIEEFLQNLSLVNLDEVKIILASNQRYDFLQKIYSNYQYSTYLKYVVPQLRVNKTCCTFFKNIPGTNCNYRCLVVTGLENTVRFLCKEDISLNIICVGGGGGGGGIYENCCSTGSYAYYGGGGAGGNTCIAKNITCNKDTLYDINVGGGGVYNYGSGGGNYIIGTKGFGQSGDTTKIFCQKESFILEARGGAGGSYSGQGGISCGGGIYNNVVTSGGVIYNNVVTPSYGNYNIIVDDSDDYSGEGVTSGGGIYNIIGGNGGNGLIFLSNVENNNLLNYSTTGQSISPNVPITNYLSSFKDILNYFNTNNFSMVINGVTCPNIIQNKYGGGGGGGGYGTYNVDFIYPGFPGINGKGGDLSMYDSYTTNPSAVTIGSGGGGGTDIGGAGSDKAVGKGGQGLVIIYWEIRKTNIIQTTISELMFG